MGDIFKHLFEFLFLKTKSLSIKILYAIVLAIALLLINDYFGFTENIFINRKLQQLQKIKELDPTTFQSDSLIKTEIVTLKYQILTKQTFIDKARKVISEISLKPLINWRSFSASLFWLSAMVMLPFMAFAKKGTRLWPRLGVVILSEIGLFLIAVAYIKVLSIVPTFEYIWINHLINYIVQILTAFFFASRSSRKKTETN